MESSRVGDVLATVGVPLTSSAWSWAGQNPAYLLGLFLEMTPFGDLKP